MTEERDLLLSEGYFPFIIKSDYVKLVTWEQHKPWGHCSHFLIFAPYFCWLAEHTDKIKLLSSIRVIHVCENICLFFTPTLVVFGALCPTCLKPRPRVESIMSEGGWHFCEAPLYFQSQNKIWREFQPVLFSSKAHLRDKRWVMMESKGFVIFT